MCRPWCEGKQRPQQCGGMDQPVRHHHIPIPFRVAPLAPIFPQRGQFLAERAAGESELLSASQSCGPDTTQTLLHEELAERGARCKRFFRAAPFAGQSSNRDGRPGAMPRGRTDARRRPLPVSACACDDRRRRSRPRFRQVACEPGPRHGPTAVQGRPFPRRTTVSAAGIPWHGPRGWAAAHMKRVAAVPQAGYEISEGLNRGRVVGTYP